MNINQIGQKKKKQAVRRLSQSRAGQGNRKEDMRRKLDAKRLANSQGTIGNSGRTKFQRGPRGHTGQGENSTRNFTSRAPDTYIPRNSQSSQTAVRKHVSPLVDPAAPVKCVTTSSEMPRTTLTNSPLKQSTSISRNPTQDTNKQGNVFGSSLFQTSDKQENIFGSSRSLKQKNSLESQQKPNNVFGAFSTSNSPVPPMAKTNTGSNIMSATTSTRGGNIAKVHPSPLAMVASRQSEATKPANVFGTSTTKSSPFAGIPGQQENIFMSSQLERPPANIFGGASKPEVSFPRSRLKSVEILATINKARSGSQSEVHSSPVTGLGSGQSNSPTIVKVALGAAVSLGHGNMGSNGGSVAVEYQQNVTRSSSSSLLAVRSSGNVLGAVAISSQTLFNVNPSAAGSGQLFPQSQSTEPTTETQVSGFGNVALPKRLFSETQNSSMTIPSTLTSGTPSAVFGNPMLQGNVFATTGLPANQIDPLKNRASSAVFPDYSTVQSTGGIFGSAGVNQIDPLKNRGSSAVFPDYTTVQSTGGIFGSAGVNQIDPLKNRGSSAVFPDYTTVQSTVSTGGIFGSGGLPTNQIDALKNRGSSAVFPDNTAVQSTGGIFGSGGLPTNQIDPLKNRGSSAVFPDYTTVQGTGGIFGSAGLPITNLLNYPGVLPLNENLNTATFSSTNADTHTSGLTSPQNASIFGGAALPSGPSGVAPGPAGFPKSSNVFSLNQSSSTTTLSPSKDPSFIAPNLQNKGNIFGNPGLPPTSTPFASENTFTSPGSGPFGSISKATSNITRNQTNIQTSPLRRTVGNISSGTPRKVHHMASVFESQQIQSSSFKNSESCESAGQPQDIQTEKILPSEKHKVISPKSLKRSASLSGVHVSELTAIVLKGLTKEYLSKELLTNCFKGFGEIKKIQLQPAKESAVVTFASHESAKKAKSKALEFFPLKELGVFWFKRRRSNSGSCAFSKISDQTGHESTSELNTRELSSRKMSISKALRNIGVSTFPPSMSAQERFTLLEEIDKIIRQAIKPYTNIATAPTIVGICPDMCPEKERYMREDRVNLSVFEMLPGTQANRDDDVPKVDHTKAVKEYSRSAADKLEPLAHEMRPVHVLQMTLDYLTANIMDNGEGRLGEWFNFLWNRTRAIRKDITQQHLCNIQCVDLVEKITRFHIFCGHYLCEEDVHCFDPKINNENLTKCLQTLKQFYLDLHSDQNTVSLKEHEFQAYDILLNLNEGDTLRKAMQYRVEVRNSPEVKFALEVFSALNSNNYVRFFKLLASASYLNACIMHRYFTQVRSRALQTMTRAYRAQEPYPLQGLLQLLAFEDKDEAMQFCAHYNLTLSNDSVQFFKSSVVDPETVFPLQRAKNAIESKRNCLIGEVVSGSPMKALSYHEPLCSFDSSGRYIGLSSLAQLLGGTPDTIEPESPDYFYEPAIAVPSSQQRSAEFDRPVDDFQQILTQEIQNTCVGLLDEAVRGLVTDISGDAITEVKLKLEISKALADKFISESLSVLVREIANQCVNEEIKIKREKIAAAECQDRVSRVVLEEILNDVLKSELVALASDARREILRKMKAQSFVKMSAVIMREMTDDVVAEQCRVIAVRSRKEIVEQKKASLWKLAETLFRNQQKKYFKRWSKEYHTRVHIRSILVEMPATPPMLTIKQQLQKLFNKQDIGGSNATRLSLSPSYTSLVKQRDELQKRLRETVEEQEAKRTRARTPIDIPKILSEMVDRSSTSSYPREVNKTKLLKLIISLPQPTQDDSPVAVQELIECKFRRETVTQCSLIPTVLADKLESLSCYTSETRRVSKEPCEYRIDIKACSGVLSSNEVKLVRNGHLFLGLTGVVFILHSSGQVRDKMFWTRCRQRLRRILRSKPRVPSIPLVIVNINSFASDDESVIKEQLNLRNLIQEGLLSQWVIYQQHGPIDSDDFHKQLVEVIQWLMFHYPLTPSIKSENVKSFVENEILKHFTIPLHEEIALRRRATLQPQCPEVIIDLYNAVINHIINVVTNATLKDISWPIPEFTTSTRDFPPVSWNSSEHLQRLRNMIGILRLPSPPPPAEDGKWKSECTLCIDYIDLLLARQPLNNFGFSLLTSVKRILMQSGKGKGSDFSTSLTAADVPWPQVVETCVGTMLSWLHSLPSLATENVYYLEKDLGNFTEPALWRVAVTESLKMAKQTTMKREKSKSPSKLRKLTSEVEQELRKVESTSSFSHAPKPEVFVEDIGEKARLLDEKLSVEKRNCDRFEEHLKSLLDEGVDVELSEIGQGIKRKCNPTWTSESKPGKTFVKKVNFESQAEIEGVSLPDLSSTLNYFETSLVAFQDHLELQRHVEEFTERQLKAALECSP